MSPRIDIDDAVCIRSGSCVHVAPGAFQLDDDGVAQAADPAAVTLEQLRRADRSCPTGAIVITTNYE